MTHDKAPATSPTPDPTRRGGSGPEGRADHMGAPAISVGDVLDFGAPEPPVGTIVELNNGDQWKRCGSPPGSWEPIDMSWPWESLAGGEYGPVTVIRVGRPT